MTSLHRAQFNPPLVRYENVKDKFEAKCQRQYDVVIFDAEDLINISRKQTAICALKNFKVITHLQIFYFVNK
jgi:hypothetical protein